MNIVVCISSVPDTTAKINFVDNDSKFDENGVQFVINPYDEFGLTKAILLKEKHGGKIIAYDPLKTSFPIWIIRSIYRPFQSDAAWEFPFGRKTLRILNTHFQVLDKRGVMGISKYYFIVQFLPLPKSLKTRFGKKAHDLDWKKSAESMKHLYLCMQVNLLLQKSNSTA